MLFHKVGDEKLLLNQSISTAADTPSVRVRAAKGFADTYLLDLCTSMRRETNTNFKRRVPIRVFTPWEYAPVSRLALLKRAPLYNPRRDSIRDDELIRSMHVYRRRNCLPAKLAAAVNYICAAHPCATAEPSTSVQRIAMAARFVNYQAARKSSDDNNDELQLSESNAGDAVTRFRVQAEASVNEAIRQSRKNALKLRGRQTAAPKNVALGESYQPLMMDS